MESNKPYNKINSNTSVDSIWDGVGYGAMSGVTGAGAVRLFAPISDGMLTRKQEHLGKKFAKIMPDNLLTDEKRSKEFFDAQRKYQNFENNANRKVARNDAIRNAYKGWKGIAIGGASALVGGIAGGVIDYYNK